MEMDGWTDRQTGDGRIDGLFVGWLVVKGLTALWYSISVYIGLSPRETEKEKRADR